MPALFQSRPETILDMFLHIANDSTIEGVAPSTMRQLRTARRRLNKFLHTIPKARQTFLELCRHPNALHKSFRLMHRLGVLSAYLPQWSQIVGQMQFDLFHVYTVDEHSVRLLNHINIFNDKNNRDKHPICCEIFPRIQKKELLIIAAIFHDIGKGRKAITPSLVKVKLMNSVLNTAFQNPRQIWLAGLSDTIYSCPSLPKEEISTIQKSLPNSHAKCVMKKDLNIWYV